MESMVFVARVVNSFKKERSGREILFQPVTLDVDGKFYFQPALNARNDILSVTV